MGVLQPMKFLKTGKLTNLPKRKKQRDLPKRKKQREGMVERARKAEKKDETLFNEKIPKTQRPLLYRFKKEFKRKKSIYD